MTTFGSICSGIEAATVAWDVLGWRAEWLAEIDKFASSVLAHHYPDVPNLGDMTTIADRVAAGEVEAPDVLVGGTPCQAFSVAGLRGGLTDARGALTLAFVRLADEIDAARSVLGKPPATVVWENVPGVLSDKTNAFGCLLGGLAGSGCELQPPGGRWANAGCVYGPARAVAWRVLDAQYFGVAQRRRRVFVVASARSGFDPAAILFEFDGVRRDTAPRREAREGTAGTLAGGARKRGGYSTDDVPLTVAHGQGGTEIAVDRGPTLTCNHEAPIAFLPETAHTLRAEGFDASEDGTGRGTPLVPVSVALRGRDGGAACEVGDDVAFTLRASSGGGDKPYVMAPVAFQGRGSNLDLGQDVTGTLGTNADRASGGARCIAFDSRQDPVSSEHISGALGSSSPQAQAIAFSAKDHGADAGDLSPTLRAMGHSGSHANGGGQVAVAAAMQVRRLTPRECERLQGFPDDYTRIPVRTYKAKPKGKHFEKYPDLYERLPDGRWVLFMVDGPRYKALGNSMAVPVMRWIGSRIAGALAVPVPANDNRQQAPAAEQQWLEIPTFLRRGND